MWYSGQQRSLSESINYLACALTLELLLVHTSFSRTAPSATDAAACQLTHRQAAEMLTMVPRRSPPSPPARTFTSGCAAKEKPGPTSTL